MSNIGFAVDLGTTTIDCCLIKKDDKTIIKSCRIKNPQSLYGSDIMNRIMTIKRDSSKLLLLKKLVIEALYNELLRMLDESLLDVSSISEICICGNATMVSILLELDVSSIGEAPFNTILKEGRIIEACDLFKKDNLKCSVYVSGCESAFIGGDILSGLYYLENHESIPQNILFLDFGTNGEIVLLSNNKWYGAATACGPAFEGGARKQKAYGNTLIDAIALGVLTGKIHKNGYINEDLKKLTISGITITNDILQQILLAKAAIVAGIYSLCIESNISTKDLDAIYLAGGFGFNLDINHACSIGLLPQCFQSKVKVLGNTSLKGAIDLLFIEDKNFVMHNKQIKTLNFAMLDCYRDLFISNMSFERSNNYD